MVYPMLLLGFLLATTTTHPGAEAFSSSSHQQRQFGIRRTSPSSLYAREAIPLTPRSPSTVTDFDGPTPVFDPQSIPEIDPDDVPELRDISNPDDFERPIPHQKWRRGDTAGCEAPITAPWRLRAEEVIYTATEFAADRPVVLDVTWFLTTVLVTLDAFAMYEMETDILKARGPVIEIENPRDAIYQDPNDPNPTDIWAHEESSLYTRSTPEELVAKRDMRNRMYAKQDEVDDADEPHNLDDLDPLVDVPLYANEESRADVAFHVSEEELERQESLEKRPISIFPEIDTAKLSTIAQAILDGLESVEEDCQVLARHELVLTSLSEPWNLESQKQFDEHRDHPVLVKTQDPFNSNRTLKGRLVSRNSMDVIINQQGRMVTIPLNFVQCVEAVGVEDKFDREYRRYRQSIDKSLLGPAAFAKFRQFVDDLGVSDNYSTFVRYYRSVDEIVADQGSEGSTDNVEFEVDDGEYEIDLEVEDGDYDDDDDDTEYE